MPMTLVIVNLAQNSNVPYVIVSACRLFLQLSKSTSFIMVNKPKSLPEAIHDHNHRGQNDARCTLSKQSTCTNVLFDLFELCTIEEQFHETFPSNTSLITNAERAQHYTRVDTY